MSRYLQAALLGLLLLPAAGCSFLFVGGPPDVAESDYGKLDYFSCTESNTWPVADVVFAGLSGLFAAGSADAGGGAIAVNLAWAGIHGASAFYGFNKVSNCRDAKAQWMRSGREQRQQSSSSVDQILRSSVLPDDYRVPELKAPEQD